MFKNFKNRLRAPSFTDILVICFISVSVIVLSTVFCINSEGKHTLIPFIGIIVFVVMSAGYFLVSGSFTKSVIEDEDENFIGSMTLELLVRMSTPVVIANPKGTVIWCNKAFSENVVNKRIIGVRFDEYTGINLSEIEKNTSDNSFIRELFGKNYSIRCYRVASSDKKYYITLWDDISELSAIKKKLSDEETTVAYVMVDNLEEIAQYVKEGMRSAANDVEHILTEWASGSSGILKEYQSNRYIFLFRAADLVKFKEDKFNILDGIREIRVGESSLPLTVSIGISDIPGTLTEKEKAASEALEMALQRGGDQAVLKTVKGLEFYGGTTQTVQKKTKVRARVVANELASRISNSSNVIVMGHRNPDFDCIGACFGIARLASFCGVRFNIIANTESADFKKCYKHISELPEYRENKDIIVNSADAQELIGPETLVVIVDVNNKGQLEAPSVAEIAGKIVYIDHHRKTAEFETVPCISYIEPSASSTCELIAEILEQSIPGDTIHKEEADVMYSGILLDTKQFTRNAGVRTFSAALYLRDAGANPSDAMTFFKTQLGEFMDEAQFESNVVIYKKYIAISCNDNADANDSIRIAAAKAADKLLSLEGVKASFALCKIGDKIHISGRSAGEINVQLILEKLKGGGHFDSAAAQLEGTISESLSCLKKAIDEYFTELTDN